MVNIEEILYTRLVLKSGVVTQKTKISEAVYHLTVTGNFSFRKMAVGQHIRILIYPNINSRLKDRLRTYSVWKYEETDEIGVCHFAICSLTDGLGSKWIHELEIGQEVLLSAPFGKFTLQQEATKHLFIGDVSTLAHYYFFRRQLSAEQTFDAIIYGDKPEHFFPDIDNSKPFEFHVVKEQTVIQIINKLKVLSLDNTMIYIGGDGRLCVALSNYLLKIRGLSKKQFKTKPFWMPGKVALE
ncbi:FAD-binding oxidoreductase [Sphingobacterium bambusae]|uniref:FAD-binding oxidoreductase n=1 Tax=Sphingobacterium bambusae TaxID=662858 RepID=A0ABW6BGR9_9SPHI|nr:FAD-binding oxidoreductase [Sphingobacterium bambusae]WPL49476.1 FAD-binding oxidoreductase [Sphingobacterium bambusae]